MGRATEDGRPIVTPTSGPSPTEGLRCLLKRPAVNFCSASSRCRKQTPTPASLSLLPSPRACPPRSACSLSFRNHPLFAPPGPPAIGSPPPSRWVTTTTVTQREGDGEPPRVHSPSPGGGGWGEGRVSRRKRTEQAASKPGPAKKKFRARHFSSVLRPTPPPPRKKLTQIKTIQNSRPTPLLQSGPGPDHLRRRLGWASLARESQSKGPNSQFKSQDGSPLAVERGPGKSRLTGPRLSCGWGP